MPSPDSLLELVRKSRLVDDAALDAHLAANAWPDDPELALASLVQAGLLTQFHTQFLRQGKHKGFFLGGYKILRPVGRGGMGVVYLAEHTELRRRAAIKLILRERVGEKGAVERFQREGRATAALDHPNIVRVYDIGQEGDVHFLVMEYVEGQSLEEMFVRRGRLPQREAIDYCVQAARGLDHAHVRGLIHRDVKPGNLLVDKEGTVKVLDLGLARFVEDNHDNLTERLGGHAILGSPDFIAPEQAIRRADKRSDVYGLGATLYTLLSGQPPFPEGSVRDKLLAHQVKPLVPLHTRNPEVPPELSLVVSRMLAKKPEHRYQSMVEVTHALVTWNNPPPPALPKPEAPAAPARAGWWLALKGIAARLFPKCVAMPETATR